MLTDHAEDDALVFRGDQLSRHRRKHEEWQYAESDQRPAHINGRTKLQGRLDQAVVAVAEAIKEMVDHATEAFFFRVWPRSLAPSCLDFTTTKRGRR